jgi:hypothetical protein
MNPKETYETKIFEFGFENYFADDFVWNGCSLGKWSRTFTINISG